MTTRLLAVVAILAIFAHSILTTPLALTKTISEAGSNVIAQGGWSDDVDGLRGRLLIASPRDNNEDGPLIHTVMYLELKYQPEAQGNPLQVRFDSDVKIELRDSQDHVVELNPFHGYNGAGPMQTALILPPGSTIRLRLGWGTQGLRGIETAPGGQTVYADHAVFKIDPHVKGDYTFCNATFTNHRPADANKDVWHGSLKLPPVPISLEGR